MIAQLGGTALGDNGPALRVEHHQAVGNRMDARQLVRHDDKGDAEVVG